MSFPVPVIFIIYNRPEKTAQVLAAIRQMQPQQLFVIADGPKDAADKIRCDAARALLKTIDWKTDLKIIQCDTNMGNVPRTISGLNEVFTQVEHAVILEDDCIPDLSFFSYCEILLEKYRNNAEVMHISGCNLLGEIPDASTSYFFSKFVAPPWGWATWRRAWQKYNPEMDSWQKHKTEIWPNISQQHFKTWTDTFEFLRVHKIGWDIPWNVDIWANRGFGIIPSVNLVTNIGFDAQATFTKNKNHFAEIPAMKMRFPLKHPVDRSMPYDKEMEEACVALLKSVSGE